MMRHFFRIDSNSETVFEMIVGEYDPKALPEMVSEVTEAPDYDPKQNWLIDATDSRIPETSFAANALTRFWEGCLQSHLGKCAIIVDRSIKPLLDKRPTELDPPSHIQYFITKLDALTYLQNNEAMTA